VTFLGFLSDPLVPTFFFVGTRLTSFWSHKIFQHLGEEGLISSSLRMCFFLGWLFPPVFLFLYSMMRAAGVTEKASRVAPLVNSWHFGDQDSVVLTRQQNGGKVVEQLFFGVYNLVRSTLWCLQSNPSVFR